MLVNWVSPRACNRVDIIEMFDKKDEHQIFERDPDWMHLYHEPDGSSAGTGTFITPPTTFGPIDWFHSCQENGTLFGHISLQGLKVLARMKGLEILEEDTFIAAEPYRLCAVTTVKSSKLQLGGAYSVPLVKESKDGNASVRRIAVEMATRNAYRQLISEADAVSFVAKDKVYFAHPIFKKDSEDAAIVKNAIREFTTKRNASLEKMPSSIILDPARILRTSDPVNISFNLGFNCIRHSRSLVFITSDRHFITKGVFRELQRAFQLKKEVLFCQLERFDSGLCKAELMPVSEKQIKNLHSNNPNEFGKVI